MAVYKGREVELLGRADGADTAPMYRIRHKDGSEEQVRLNTIQLTEDERKQQEEQSAQHLEYAGKIDDKDLQWVRDSQNPEKIREWQKNQKTEPVEVSKVMVDPSEIQEKSTITPQMTTDARPEKKAKK